MNAASAHDALFGDVLACEEIRPAAFLPCALDTATERSLGARAEALLRALAVVEDGVRSSEEPEQSAADVAMHRLEAKLDLLTALVANLGANHDSDPLTPLQWSARGACIAVPAPLPVDTTGRLRVQPADWLPSPLILPARVLACDTDATGTARAWLAFGPLSPLLEAALERHLFRVHRRAIAESRRPR